MQLTFGAGEVFATMIQDAQGNAVTNPTPIRIAGIQESSLSFDGELKEYYGANRYALATAMGKVKTTGKLKAALINGLALNTLFFASSLTTGTMKAIYADTTGSTIPASTPYTITPTIPNSGTFVADMGVQNSSGQTMTLVTGTPTTGQYSVSAGVYTFAAADAGQTVYISFSYTYAVTAAKSIPLNNIPMGTCPKLALSIITSYGGKKCLVELAAVTSTKLAMLAGKNDDFSVPELDYSAQTDASGYKLGTIWVQE